MQYVPTGEGGSKAYTQPKDCLTRRAIVEKSILVGWRIGVSCLLVTVRVRGITIEFPCEWDELRYSLPVRCAFAWGDTYKSVPSNQQQQPLLPKTDIPIGAPTNGLSDLETNER